MIPKYLVPKEPVKPNSEFIKISMSSGKVECCNCLDKYHIESGFIILRPDSNKFEPMCGKCAQIRMFGKVIYFEDYPTFIKRLKTNQFKEWKVTYEEN